MNTYMEMNERMRALLETLSPAARRWLWLCRCEKLVLDVEGEADRAETERGRLMYSIDNSKAFVWTEIEHEREQVRLLELDPSEIAHLSTLVDAKKIEEDLWTLAPDDDSYSGGRRLCIQVHSQFEYQTPHPSDLRACGYVDAIQDLRKLLHENPLIMGAGTADAIADKLLEWGHARFEGRRLSPIRKKEDA